MASSGIFFVLLAANSAAALTIDEVIQMVKSGQTDDAVMNKIRDSAAGLPLNLEDIYALRSAGTSKVVIKAEIDHNLPRIPQSGSGTEYDIRTDHGQLDLTTVIEESSVEGYWKEMRITTQIGGKPFTSILKTYMSGEPRRPTREIIQANGLNPREITLTTSGQVAETAQDSGTQATDIAIAVLGAFLDVAGPIAGRYQAHSLAGLHSLAQMSSPKFQRSISRSSIALPNVQNNQRFALRYTNPGHGESLENVPTVPSSIDAGVDQGNISSTNQSPSQAPTSPQSSNEDENSKFIKVGNETIQVEAGKFEGVHYIEEGKGGHTDVWVSPTLATSIMPMGILKMVSADGKISFELKRLLVNEPSQIPDLPYCATFSDVLGSHSCIDRN
jgi:hypothetical protein